MSGDANQIVFVNGHWLGRCDREHGELSCDCSEDYESVFGCCYGCGEKLDKYGECPDGYQCGETA